MNKHRTSITNHNNKQSFSQTSLNSSIIRLPEYKLKNTVLKLIKPKKKKRGQKPADPFGLGWGRR